MTDRAWNKAAARLAKALYVDAYHGRRRVTPWRRAACNMANRWHIRMGMPPAVRARRRASRPTWEAFARLAADIAGRKARRTQVQAWHAWASRRASTPRRYVPKSLRGSQQARP